jgi:hypothetical protein
LLVDGRYGLELKVFFFESFLYLEIGLAFCSNALFFHIALNASVHSLSEIRPLANIPKEKRESGPYRPVVFLRPVHEIDNARGA